VNHPWRSSDPGGMCRNTSHGGGMRRDGGGTLPSPSPAPAPTPAPTPSPTPSRPPPPNPDTDANAERRHDVHDYVRGSVTTDVDRATRDACDIRQQRHARARDGLRSTPGSHGLSRDQSGGSPHPGTDEVDRQPEHQTHLRLPRSLERHEQQSQGSIVIQ
jgi:hypothetical protein